MERPGSTPRFIELNLAQGISLQVYMPRARQHDPQHELHSLELGSRVANALTAELAGAAMGKLVLALADYYGQSRYETTT